jgi:hypothetical protein
MYLNKQFDLHVVLGFPPVVRAVPGEVALGVVGHLDARHLGPVVNVLAAKPLLFTTLIKS